MEGATKKGLIWSAIERGLSQVLSFALALILARLVTPSDYGILAITVVIVTVAGILVDAGFGNALIQRVDATDTERSTVLVFNVSFSFLIYASIWISAPYVASYYNNLDLTDIVRTISVVVIINSLGVVHNSILIAGLEFKKAAYISLVSSLISGITGIILAYIGYGIWALIVQVVLIAVVKTVMFWALVKWTPSLLFSIDSFKSLFSYSYKLVISSLLVQSGKQVNQVLLGKYLGFASLGFYNYSYRLVHFISYNISLAFQRVLFPSLSRVQEDAELMVKEFRSFLCLSMIIITPLMFYISCYSEPIIGILLTEKWYPVIPLLSVNSITMAIWPLLFLNINVLWVKGRTDLSLKLEVVNLILRTILVISCFNYGLLWVCVALLIAEILNFIIYSVVVGKVCGCGFKRQMSDLGSIFLAAGISVYLANIITTKSIDGSLYRLICGFLVTFLLYIGLLYCNQYYRKLLRLFLKGR